MKYRLKFQHTFEKEAKRLGKRYMSMKSDIASLSEELLANPHLGTDLGGGLRKIRMAITSKGKGKSGGARVITLTVLNKLPMEFAVEAQKLLSVSLEGSVG